MLNQNQFKQIAIQGQLDLLLGGSNVVSCVVNAAESTPLIPGQAVKLVNPTVVGGVPQVTACAADTDDVFGFVNFSVKNASFPAGVALEISIKGTVMQMTASGSIVRGQAVMLVISGSKVAAKTAAVKKSVIGWAYDAGLDGDLVRVYIETPNLISKQSLTDLADAPATLTANNFLKVNGGGTAVVNSAT